jgi:hypothetical protein
MPATAVFTKEAGLGKRLLRGLGWGPLYGQWWTLWVVLFSERQVATQGPLRFILTAILVALFFGFFGTLTGLTIAIVAPAQKEPIGGYIGIGIGLLLYAIDVFIFKDPMKILTFWFFYISGQFIGKGLARRILQPV